MYVYICIYIIYSNNKIFTRLPDELDEVEVEASKIDR